jgi:cytochrome c-type biogenesis protein
MAEQTVAPTIKAAYPMTAQRRWSTFVQGVYFILGFASFIMIVMGLVSTALSDVFVRGKDVIRIVGGIALIVFGLFTLKIINIPALYSDTRRGLGGVSRTVGGAQSFVTGLSFAAGWSPCIGPFLGAILSMAATAEALPQRLALLAAYVFGLGIPFLLVAALADRMLPLLAKLKRHMRKIELVSGLLLVAIGIAMLLNQISYFSRQLSSVEGLESLIPEGTALSIPVAALAGLLSFVSPCVLPLLPAYIGFIGGWAINNANATTAK